MQDLTETLAGLAHGADNDTSPSEVDGDVRRGRQALMRRRARRGLGGAVAAAALAGSLAYLDAQPSTHRTPNAASGVHSTEHVVRGDAIKLAAYDGRQLPGFIVSLIPRGWKLQGSTGLVLVIAPSADNTSIDDFEGKLVVMLQSQGVSYAWPGTPVSVHGQAGAIEVQQGTRILRYRDRGREVNIQSPPRLGWTDDQLASFANGVTVTSNAKPGQG